ncbi:MAG: SLBB domain-containing protein [Microcoleus sp. PH2017_29_MFU_D_A]|nr:SLBB domain-containing protein [Microcoleus sp. PH2017_02_FOX_O_A]MCC3418593.1 SLBB domain-containing protein [Microcoleus sp. PH2017_07_MST_O_A]MCC3425400.1 SLBB domain-containing protein [Microcoleus sp. PH2017_01_SCD_O_A]MCC3429243.1 SLBB domain-containing protein [Microcoleus sp. PH2017_04_SCI_O_A]MCC3437070.1 SLBB domain-containing protein [Microcoleus sp. PH2017_05_CCC_O_A]MCC3443473.1 SLBB domain-containing protein [Microcoleus sp. PH2017_03_ELD_O_A]MCC3450586.1 SLBB domain-containi
MADCNQERKMKHNVQTATSLSLSALLVLSSSLPSIAQLPAIRNPAPARNQNRPRVPPPPPPGSSFPRIGNSGSLIQEAAYTLGPGDRIALDIFGVPEFSKEYQVLVDGTLNLPIIRSVSIQGLTLQQAATVITKRYEPFINVPVVTVTLMVTRPLNIGVAGEVTRPGSYKINASREGTGGGVKFPTLMEMLQVAKGVTSAGDMRNVQIRRPRRGGAEQLITVNLQDFLDTGNLSQDVTIRDGDTIFVPTASALNTQEVRQRASASFSADITKPIGVVIVGEVNRPGPYTVSASDLRSTNQQTDLSFVSIEQQQGGGAVVGLPTITRALKIAGGITTEADIRRVQIRRRIRGGTEQTITVNLWDLLQKGDATQDVLLQEGDSVIIPTASTVDLAEVAQLGSTSFSPNAISINIVGEVIRPGALQVKPSTSLHQALLTAGSFNQLRAKKDKVELLRLNPNGTVTRRTINVDFAQGLNPDNNPTLRNNDVILVARSGYTRVADNIATFLQPITGVAGGISSVSGIFTGFQTTINAFQNLFLGGDFDRRNQLRQLREQREDRQEQRQDRLLDRELQREERQRQAEDRQQQAEDRRLQLEDRQRQIELQDRQLQIQQQQNQQLQQLQPQQIMPTTTP